MQTMTGVSFFLFLCTYTLVNLVFGCRTKGEFKLAAVQTKQTGDTALLPDSQGTTCLSRPAHIHPPLSSSRSLSFPLSLSPIAFGCRSGWASWSICACLRHWTVVDVGQSCKSVWSCTRTAIVTSGDTAKPDAKRFWWIAEAACKIIKSIMKVISQLNGLSGARPSLF